MTTTKDKPVDRDAWRRLLDSGDGPPALTDARIRAKARQALTPRTARWWLPASLAASMLLAIALVQQQYERPRAPAVVSESDYAAPAEASVARGESLLNETPPRQDAIAPASPPVRAALPANAANAESKDRRAAELEQAREEGFFAPPPPVVPHPQIELPPVDDAPALGGIVASAPAAEAPPAPAAQEAQAKREEDVSEIVVTGSRRREGDRESTTPVTQVTAEDVSGQAGLATGALMKSDQDKRTPEQWYAEIEKLRAAGKKREARRELEKLEEVHPGWLEKNHPTER